MAGRCSANNTGQGVKRGPAVNIFKYSDSSNNKRQGVKSGPKAPKPYV